VEDTIVVELKAIKNLLLNALKTKPVVAPYNVRHEATA
jgi:hypothetical protein